ncbi:hypothetical protein A2791_03595 [Candidatus Saccharibacteria bacterium RIFCSPHIGHO2_01_FULL_46_30]|nr:MAG: hypothetical protein A2791_03595 [Candidatus Saccharibacteria bacterium RIFCSPHIGHO2_01_FULL_46_30]
MFKRVIAVIVAIGIVSVEIIQPVQAATIDQQFYSANDIMFYDPTCAEADTTGSVQLAGDGTMEQILNFFMRKGLTLAQASGIIGNMAQESGGAIDQKTGVKTPNPAVRQGGKIVDANYTPENGVGFGLVQWTFTGRQKPLQDHMKEMGVGMTDLGGQLEFVWKELNSNYTHTLQALKSTTDPVAAAVAMHGPPNPGYEASADSPEAVRSVRGGNAQKVYDTYKDAPALAGGTADSSLAEPPVDGDKDKAKVVSNPTRSSTGAQCDGDTFSGGDLAATVKAYAWDTHKGLDINARAEYTSAVNRATSEQRYVGGIKYKGIDCGGFVSLLLQDSKTEPTYNNSGKGGNTISQEAWLRNNWESISATDASDRLPGDVAINDTHTYIYVGDIEGFNSKIASASLDERAPMAGKEGVTDGSFRWYRKKSGVVNV